MSKLVKAQSDFLRKVSYLIQFINEYVSPDGTKYTCTGGDLYRDDRCHYGSKSSRHRMRLAVDINLFEIKGDTQVYCPSTEDHAPFGEWWEQQGGIWGGQWNDGNHYEWPLP